MPKYNDLFSILCYTNDSFIFLFCFAPNEVAYQVINAILTIFVCMCGCVCVFSFCACCVCALVQQERERRKERERDKKRRRTYLEKKFGVCVHLYGERVGWVL